MGNYLFGEIDVPQLDLSDSQLEPYDSTRRLKLNPQHPVSQVLIPFIASKLDEVRQGLVARYKEEQKSRESRRLAQEAARIANVLNNDFRSLRQRLDEIRVASSSPGPAAATFGGSGSGASEENQWVEGSQEPGFVEEPSADGRITGRGRNRAAPDVPQTGRPDLSGSAAVDPVGGSQGVRKRPSAGFQVAYRHLGEEETDRSRYDAATLTILINLDHPSIGAALEDSGVDGVAFRRLSYEIAFAEYAFSLENHFLEQDPDKPASDALYDVRAALNRVAAAAAELYR